MGFSTKGTVTIDLAEYERLVKVYNAVEDNKSFLLRWTSSGVFYVYNQDEALAISQSELEQCREELTRCQLELEEATKVKKKKGFLSWFSR